MKKRAITQQEKIFVDAVLRGERYATAIDIAYPEYADRPNNNKQSKADQLLRRPLIQEYMEQQRRATEKARERIIAKKAEWALSDSIDALKFVVRMAQNDAIVVNKRNMQGGKQERVITSATASAIIGAVEGINKLLGFGGKNSESVDVGETLASRILNIESEDVNPDDYTETPQGLTNGKGNSK